jgi:hypothetical protein
MEEKFQPQQQTAEKRGGFDTIKCEEISLIFLNSAQIRTFPYKI